MSTSAETSITHRSTQSPQYIVEFSCSGVSIRAKFVTDNLDVVQHVKHAFPVSTLTNHVLTAGETILFAFHITYLGKEKMAPHLPGTVYCNLGSKALATCYGDIKQAGTVIEIATVLPEDMEKLRASGKLVKKRTQRITTPYLIRTQIRMLGNSMYQPVLNKTISALALNGSWQSALEVSEWHMTRLNNTSEPDEMKAIRLSAVENANWGTWEASLTTAQ
ncbi:hypothetical protein MMC08_005018 [Hypocenomyce scalaris]|nr:hypothetical protein [Hypocenomyce scalaris]